MKLSFLSGITCRMSPDSTAPLPRPPSAQCSTVPPVKWPGQLISVRPGAISCVAPSQNRIAGSGRVTHCRSEACSRIGASNARAQSAIAV